MEILTDPVAWLSLVMLTGIEVVLGVDNLVFLAILTNRLPEADRPTAERIGLGFALGCRLAVLAGVTWLSGMTEPMFTIFGFPASWRTLVLAGGGLFLLAKGTHEIHGALEGDEDEAPESEPGKAVPFWRVAADMVVLDAVFSLDSVATAVGLAGHVWVMAAALVAAMVLMLVAAEPLSEFLARHPTVKMLTLAFVLMIGLTLLAEGLGVHVPKAYLYFAIGVAITIEALNLLIRHRQKPVRLRHPTP